MIMKPTVHPTDTALGAAVPKLGIFVRDIMRAGVVSVPEDASLRHVQRAMAAHDVHAVLVVGTREGTPRGWVTAHGLLAYVHHDPGLTRAATAITEPVVGIEPTATVAEAVEALAGAVSGHLVVAAEAGRPPEGVVSDLDIVRLLAG